MISRKKKCISVLVKVTGPTVFFRLIETFTPFFRFSLGPSARLKVVKHIIKQSFNKEIRRHLTVCNQTGNLNPLRK